MRIAQTKVDRRPQRNIHRGRQPQDHISARRRPTGFDGAYMPCVVPRQPPGPIENGRASYAIPSIAGRMGCARAESLRISPPWE